MSYHILHISEYGCKLSKERGLLVCKKDGAVLGKIAIEDRFFQAYWRTTQ